MLAPVDASTMGAGAAVSDSTVTEVRRKRGRPRDPGADGRILAAAASLILLRGFDNMTVDEVATNAGVGKATVYRRWARKEDLAVAAMEQLYRDEMPPPDTGTIRGDLRVMYQSVLTFARSPTGMDYLRTSIKESMRDERIATLYREANRRAEQTAVAVFERAITRGEVRPDVPMDVLVQLLVGMVAMRAIHEQEMPRLEDVDTLVDLMLVGIST
jgi:AcrR family transcriptional regulator